MRRLGIVIFAVVVAACGSAWALDPARSLLQYRHSTWTAEDGAPVDVRAIAQTPDGFLWLGSYQGLYRFDGARFERYRIADPEHRLSPFVQKLLVARDGSLIVGFSGGGVGRIKNGKFVHLRHPDVRLSVLALAEGRDGSIWASLGQPGKSLARYRNGAWRILDADWNTSGEFALSLLVDRRGDLWVAGNGELARLREGQDRFRKVDLPVGTGPGLFQASDGVIWIADSLGLRAIDPMTERLVPQTHHAIGQTTRWTQVLMDRDRNIWGATWGGGLFRVRGPLRPRDRIEPDSRPEEVFRANDGLTSDIGAALLEDREGNIWVGTAGGLERFSPAAVVIQPQVERDPAWDHLLRGGKDGSVYVLDTHAIYRARPGETLKPWVTNAGSPRYFCDAGHGVFYISTDRGLFRRENGRMTRLATPAALTFDANCEVDGWGNLWIAAYEQGVAKWDGRAWTRFEATTGRAFFDLALQEDGNVLIATGRRLYRAGPRGFDRLDMPKTLSGGTIQSLSPEKNKLRIGMDFGLLDYSGAASRLLSVDNYPWAGDVQGVVTQPSGETWMVASSGVVRTRTAQLDEAFKSGKPIDARVFDMLDGFAGVPSVKGGDLFEAGPDGRIWFATSKAVFMVDPTNIPFNTTPPPVAIRSVTIDGRTHEDPKDLVLPKGAKSLQIDYTALSLTQPERVKFRYKLEGVDEDWVDPGTRRQAFYTNLRPGRYVFKVKASNNDGVWNQDGASLSIRLPPTFLQSKLFLALCAAAAAVLLWLAYTLRLRRVSARIQERLEERLAERERIARELHDTLLQGVQGLVLKFQSASDDVPADTPARGSLERALDRAEAMMVEARDRVRSLRVVSTGDLSGTLAEVAQRIDPEGMVTTNVVTEGASRDLHPIVFDEIERIVTEALFNAYSHAAASLVTIEIAYDARQLGVRVRDNGVGIEQGVLDRGGREGHFGLAGMRERAIKIGGQLVVRSRPSAGTEVEVTVPAPSAYRVRSRAWPSLWPRLYSRRGC